MKTSLTIVSGACSLYFRSLLQLLLSLTRWGYFRVIVYDLGLVPEQRGRLSLEFSQVEVRPLPPGPEHIQDVSNYAFKPTAIAQVLLETQAPVLWLDSACVVVGSLRPVLKHLGAHGVWVPIAGRGALGQRSHPFTLQALAVEDWIRSGRFRAGGVCAFDVGATDLVCAWRALAWNQSLLAPPGSNRANHRYDQTLLSVLVARSGLDASRDEIDISSARPVPYLRTRNKVSNRVPLALDPLVRIFFWTLLSLDVLLWRLRARGVG